MAEAKNREDKQAKDEMVDQVTEAREENIDVPQDATHTDVEQKSGDTTPEQTGDATEDETEEAKADRVAKAGKHSAKAIREAEAEDARQEAKEHRAEHEDEEPKAAKRQMPNPLHQHGKKYREAAKLVEVGKAYSLNDALDLAQKTATTKFDASVELHVNLGVDPRQADQMVRSTPSPAP